MPTKKHYIYAHTSLAAACGLISQLIIERFFQHELYGFAGFVLIFILVFYQTRRYFYEKAAKAPGKLE